MYYYRDSQDSKKWFKSLLKYLRDILVAVIPIPKMPSFLIKKLYGGEIDFVFCVHARRSQDFFVSIPALTILRKWLGKRKFLKLMAFLPAKVVSFLTTSSNQHGLVLVSPLMPGTIGTNRQKALKEMKRMLTFAKRISNDRLVVGLGGWWPIVTNRGKYLKRVDSQSIITTGHTVTILSICLTIDKIAKLGGISKNRIKVIIIGAGKIGLQVASILMKEGVQQIAFVDINEAKLTNIYSNYKDSIKNLNVYNFNTAECSKKEILDKYHLAVCATSTSEEIIKEKDIPANFIIIDDSRPEAISRNLKSEDKIVLEGGLMKIAGLTNDYDYGFGKGHNFFGCFCESYILSLDTKKAVAPTIGDVDYDNYKKYKNFCTGNEISVGDFKSAKRTFSDLEIKNLIVKRKKYLENDEFVHN